MPGLQQPVGQVAADQPRATRDENPHEYCPLLFVSKPPRVNRLGQAELAMPM